MPSIIYTRPVFYYETDRMDCVHHSNYIRWFEEARIHFMRQAGFPYEELEAAGIVSCGGTMKLAGLSNYLQSVLNCPVYVTEDPTMTVTDGLSILLTRME